MRVAIIEDEPLAAERLRDLLLAYPSAAIDLLGETDSVAEAIELIPEWQADLLLCDIHLADGLSFNIWQHVEVNCPVIFTTAFEQYTLKAFKVNSIDYLLKPVQAEELYAALDRFQVRQKAAAVTETSAAFTASSLLNPAILAELTTALRRPNFRQRLMSKVGDRLVPILVESIAFFESIDRITWAYLPDGKRHALGETLDELEGTLDPQRFRRLNRAVIAQDSAVEQLMPYSNSRYRAQLRGHLGEPIIVARERVASIRAWLGGEAG